MSCDISSNSKRIFYFRLQNSLLNFRKMTRVSPNKRKALEPTTPGSSIPKKVKVELQSPKNPSNTPNKTPKSGKKGVKVSNGGATPKLGETPKSIIKAKTENSDENMINKTPKSAKKGKKQANINTPKPTNTDITQLPSDEKMDTTDEKVVKKMSRSAKKAMKKQNQAKSSGKQNNENAAKSVKSTTIQKMSHQSSDESDYEVEIQIKPEKITKSLNSPESDDEAIVGAAINDDSEEGISANDEDQESNEEDEPQKTKSIPKSDKKGEKQNKSVKLNPTLNMTDLSKSGIVKKGQTRYVLYVNNIPYDVTKDKMKEHFAKACNLKDVRIPTDKKTKKPKGFCYVELSTEEEYQVCVF